MFTWGRDALRGFRLRDGSLVDGPDADDGRVRSLELGYRIADVSVGRNVLVFVKTNGNPFIIRTNEGKDGGRVRGKQKFVKCKEKIVAVSCGDDVVTLLSERGSVLCVDNHTYIPRPLEALSKQTVCQVACGSHHSVALTKDGQVYTWGQDSRGQLGLGKKKLGTSSPQHLRSMSATPLVQVAAGGQQSFALSVSGGLFSWGGNDFGQLGLGDRTERQTPACVQSRIMKKAVHVSCGENHTAILTKDGAVLTFGSGQYGQLGHNSLRDELRPRLVAELWGAKVTKVACGRDHTLVLTDSERIYSFGRGDEGQLGRDDESVVPLPVQVPQGIKNIFAGGNCSYASCSSDEEVHVEPNMAGVNNRAQHCLDDMIDRWTSECDSKSWKKIKGEIHRAFSSASCMNQSFLEQSRDKHFQTSPKCCGLNLSHARRAFKKLVKKDLVLAEVEDALLLLLPTLGKKPVGLEGLRIYLLLNELLHVIQRHKRRRASTALAEAVATAVTNLSPDSLQVIGDWWSSMSPSTMVKHVKVWTEALSVVLSSHPVSRRPGVRNLLQVLQYMYNANSRIAEPQRMPESDFCLLMSDDFLFEDLDIWHIRPLCMHGVPRPLILCDFPIVMDLKAKKTVFDMNTQIMMDGAISAVILCDMVFSFGSYFDERDLYVELDLRRASLLEDTFAELSAIDSTNFKMPLAVYFDENPTLDDVYKKDFFYEVFHEMMSPESGMFMFNDSETLAWFPSNARLAQEAAQEDQRYFHFGLLCGLALYNQCIIFLPFPLALFKKLLGMKPSLQDLMEFDPSVGESLRYILVDYQDDDLENLGMSFSITWDGKEVDLDPENPEKPVTSQNKKEFVNAYVNHAFNTSVEGMFQEFKRGFFQICERDLVKLFRPKELQSILVGKDFQDWAKLRENIVYEREYHVDHPTIQMFWEVFDELNEDQKRAFLWFVTGFERVPILGMEKIKMKVKVKRVEDLTHDQYYPEAHTCDSRLELPLYSTKEIMQSRLTEALSSNHRIFG